MNQRREDVALLNRDDPIVMKVAQNIEAQRIYFSLREELKEGVSYRNQTLLLRIEEREETYFIGRAPLKGVHNIENMMAAVTAARLVGCSREAIEAVLARFEGLEHRLEFVREMDGVRFYNDSKGTNVGSVVKSLESFSEPVVLIAGGKDKAGDLSSLKALIGRRVKRLILIGEAKERMAKELGGLTDTTMARTLEEAVLLAHKTAQKGEIVLLSPACSSFDMFKDYKERGRVFKEAVRRL